MGDTTGLYLGIEGMRARAMTMREQIETEISDGRISTELCEILHVDKSNRNRTQQVARRSRKIGLDLICFYGVWTPK